MKQRRARRVGTPQYNCGKCPGYCCSYPLIPLDKRDVERLAKHHDMTFEVARKTWSPTMWPKESFTTLKRSRSM